MRVHAEGTAYMAGHRRIGTQPFTAVLIPFPTPGISTFFYHVIIVSKTLQSALFKKNLASGGVF